MATPLNGLGKMGVARSVRLPRPLDEWFDERLQQRPERTQSELLVELIHGGLRLREGYMAIHKRALEELDGRGDASAHATYLRALSDTFGPVYVDHLLRWIAADERGHYANSLTNSR
jgi:hypothetical protein